MVIIFLYKIGHMLQRGCVLRQSYISGWPRTHSIAKDDIELFILPLHELFVIGNTTSMSDLM